jgi:Lysylphosphatidylglycerol synthase TM region
LVFLFLACIFMFFNWFLEAAKWKLLMNKNEKISFVDSLRAIVSGIALSIITPNQIGDFAGRIIHLKKFDKIKGSLVAVIGHTAQVILCLAFGLFAFIFLQLSQNKITEQTALGLTVFSVFISIAAVLGFLNIHFISKVSRSKKIIPYLEVFSLYTKLELWKVFVFSFFRYSIFIIQYLLLLQFFGVEIYIGKNIACVVATLCAQTFVPSLLLVELGIRGATALYFFSFYTNNFAGVLLSSYSLWIINLMVPSFLGLFVIVKHKFKK